MAQLFLHQGVGVERHVLVCDLAVGPSCDYAFYSVSVWVAECDEWSAYFKRGFSAWGNFDERHLVVLL